MSIESDWRAIEVELRQSPRVLADLRPPLTEAEATDWSGVTGPLPVPLRQMYDVHAGATTRGSGGFSFIGDWFPLPIEQAIRRYVHCRRLAEAWERPPLIPFAVDPSGSYLAVHPGGAGELSIILDDSGDAPYSRYQDIATLLAETVQGLRGNNEDYRADLTADHLSWINLEEASDDMGY